MSSIVPFASVIIVNYNGARYLPACLDGLKHQTYPADRFEVIVSDNGSTDGSQEFITHRYNNIQLLDNKKNLGFAAGNNVALRIARGDYIVLLNNDTAPTPTWLENLVDTAERHPEAGLVTGRIRLFYDQLTVTLQSDLSVKAPSNRSQGLRIYGVETGLLGGAVQYLEGFSGWLYHPDRLPFRQFSGSAKLGVPAPQGSGDWDVSLLLSADRDEPEPKNVRIMVGDTPLDAWEVGGKTPDKYRLHIPHWASALTRPLIQNAGSIVFKNGAGRDRGTVVRNFEAFYEEDHEQFNAEEEVFAGCGANLLLRREMLREVGFFDADFFMYYEDTDLAWRARLMGWKVFYAPQGIIRHIHCGTSQEWSPSFIFYTDRNRLAMLFKNGHWSSILREWGLYFLKSLGNAYRILRILFLKRKNPRPAWGHLRIQGKVLFSLFCWLPRLGKDRLSIQKSRSVSESEIALWLEPPS
jgi:GT2 family glycosyltransferase